MVFNMAWHCAEGVYNLAGCDHSCAASLTATYIIAEALRVILFIRLSEDPIRPLGVCLTIV